MTPIPAQYTKRPVTVEAARLEGSNAHTHAIYQWVESHVGSFNPDMTPPPTSGISIDPSTGNIMIATLEGIMTASMGDWIIRGIHGEFYPCKHEIFTATYQPADEEPARARPSIAIEVVARGLLANHPRSFSREDYPGISARDWDAIVARANELADSKAPSPVTLQVALKLLASRATKEQDL